jgi:hypothetical protein
MVIATINAAALALFAIALCWRIDRIRREGAGLQPTAMTVAISAMTLAFVSINPHVREWLDSTLFTGAARVIFYCLLAFAVAALVIVFFFGSAERQRQRRAGVEAVPLVIAMIGLNVAMLVTPTPVRTESVSEWTVQHFGFALFFVIAGCYLVYGLGSCVLSIRRYVGLADGYLRHSLMVLLTGLSLVGLGSLIQTVFVVLSGLGLATVPVLLKISAVISSVGAVLFLAGICYPMVRARWIKVRYNLRHRRDYADLEPLWSLTTSALPEVVLPLRSVADVDGSINLLYQRRVVEIRDALLQLSPLLPDDFDRLTDRDQVFYLRDAVEVYREAGGSSGAVRQVLVGAGDDLDAEATPLLRISRALADQPVARKHNRTG